jgi:hypothetical protein
MEIQSSADEGKPQEPYGAHDLPEKPEADLRGKELS